MRKLVIASHSNLAKGFKETLEFLTGQTDRIKAVCAYVESNEDIDQQVAELMSEEGETIVLTDMAGGSVNQKFFPYISDRVHVIAGLNLPLAMSILLQIDAPTLDLNKLVLESQQQIQYMNAQSNDTIEEDE
ncbi:PTS sugar transporter subunit IIA [Enterococcus sp. AD013-P3]|uniref:PTS sugar transporter subunit IIA n=1 Tax=Enterococcus sp. AD013-P3 TaxID=3411036 RepID=UPI003B92E4F9